MKVIVLLQVENRVTLKKWIVATEESHLHVPILSYITDISMVFLPNISLIFVIVLILCTDEPAIGDPFNVTAYLEHRYFSLFVILLYLHFIPYRALVDRVNQDFACVANVSTPFTIQFPVQNSLIKGGNAILFGEEAPLVFSVHNISALRY